MRRGTCSTEGCSKLPIHASGHGLCGNCYSYMNYWLKKKSVSKIIKRKQAVELYANRLDSLIGNVKTVTTRKRKTG